MSRIAAGSQRRSGCYLLPLCCHGQQLQAAGAAAAAPFCATFTLPAAVCAAPSRCLATCWPPAATSSCRQAPLLQHVLGHDFTCWQPSGEPAAWISALRLSIDLPPGTFTYTHLLTCCSFAEPTLVPACPLTACPFAVAPPRLHPQIDLLEALYRCARAGSLHAEHRAALTPNLASAVEGLAARKGGKDLDLPTELRCQLVPYNRSLGTQAT